MSQLFPARGGKKNKIRTPFLIMNDKGAVLNNNTKDVSEYGGISFIEACLVAMRIHLSRFFLRYVLHNPFLIHDNRLCNLSICRIRF